MAASSITIQTIHRRSPKILPFLLSFFVDAWKSADVGMPEDADELQKSFRDYYDRTYTLEDFARTAYRRFRRKSRSAAAIKTPYFPAPAAFSSEHERVISLKRIGTNS